MANYIPTKKAKDALDRYRGTESTTPMSEDTSSTLQRLKNTHYTSDREDRLAASQQRLNAAREQQARDTALRKEALARMTGTPQPPVLPALQQMMNPTPKAPATPAQQTPKAPTTPTQQAQKGNWLNPYYDPLMDPNMSKDKLGIESLPMPNDALPLERAREIADKYVGPVRDANNRRVARLEEQYQQKQADRDNRVNTRLSLMQMDPFADETATEGMRHNLLDLAQDDPELMVTINSMTEDQKRNAYYLMGKHYKDYSYYDEQRGEEIKRPGQIPEEVMEYLETLKPGALAAYNQEITEGIEQMSEEHPVAAGAASLFNMNAGSVRALGQGVYDAAAHQITGRPADPNSLSYMQQRIATAQRQGVSTRAHDDVYDLTGSETLANAASFLSQTGLDALNSYIISGIPAGGTVMGASAGADALVDSIDRGVPPEAAIFNGAIQGYFEGLFENYFTIANLRAFKTAENSRSILKQIAFSMFSNAFEEGATEIADSFADYFITADDSKLASDVRQYMESGMDERDAWIHAYIDLFKDAGLAALGGAISAGLSGSFAGYVRSRELSRDARNLTAETARDLSTAEADENVSPDLAERLTESSGRLADIAARMEGGETVSQREKKTALRDYTADTDAITSAALEDLARNQVETKAQQRQAIVEAGESGQEDSTGAFESATLLTDREKEGAYLEGLQNRAASEREAVYAEQGRNDLSDAGSGRSLALRSGQQVEGVDAGTGRDGSIGSDWANAADTGRESGTPRITGQHQAKQVLPAAQDGQVIYTLDRDTYTPDMRKSEAMAAAYGVGIDQYAGDGPIVITEGGETKKARAWSNPKTRRIGNLANLKEGTSSQFVKHEMTEFAIMDGKVTVKGGMDRVKEVIGDHTPAGSRLTPGSVLDVMSRLYMGRAAKLNLMDRSQLDQYRKAQADANKELLCDLAGGINQFKGKAGFEEIAELFDTISPEVSAWVNEQIGGAFDAEEDSISAAPAVSASDTSKPSDPEIAKNPGIQYSTSQFAESVGLGIRYENGNKFTIINKDTGQAIKRLTSEQIKDTPMGMLIDVALKRGTITPGIAEKQRKMFADLMNLTLRYDPATAPMVWEVASSQLFSSIKNNSDPQYRTTVDYGTICSKTQALIDNMSDTMLKLGRGLTRDEVIRVYNKTAGVGLSVPCPVCYVFSRWMGVPSLLETMRRCQERYGTMSDSQIQNYISNMIARYGSAKGVNDRKTKVQNRIDTLQRQMQTALSKHDQKTIDKIATETRALERELEEVESFNWVTQVLCTEKDGNYKKDSKFKPVPNSVLLDLRKTGDFAKSYPKSWKYRCTRGAGMGKAIMPYSGATIGDFVKGNKDRYTTKNNPFLNMDYSKANRAMGNAITRAKQQNLVGGQRFQSTSDFRAEWGIDYLMTFLECQAVGSQVQLYTKVIEAVDLFATAGVEVNLSIMPKDNGVVIGKNGKAKLVFSDVTGINFEQALAKTRKYSNVQMILVGISDEHIRLAMADDRITFIIPWHSSGNSKDTLAQLMSAVGEDLDVSTNVDYTDSQEDKIFDNSEAAKETRQLRLDIIQGKLWDNYSKRQAKALTERQQEILDGNRFLNDLYNRFYVDTTAQEYGVKLAKVQAEKIFPYEYWDKSLTIKDADENGRRFVEYCTSLGITPRFSQFKDNPGYWKTLIDRRMYNIDGTYHEPKAIDVTGIKVGSIPTAVNSNNYKDTGKKAQAVYDTLQALSDQENDLRMEEPKSEGGMVFSTAIEETDIVDENGGRDSGIFLKSPNAGANITKALTESGYNYRYYGIRTADNKTNIGDTLPASYNAADDSDGEMLAGTSATGFGELWYNEDDLAEVEKAIDTHNKNRYRGKYHYLIGGNNFEYGNDPSEVVIEDAEVVGIITRDGQVITNDTNPEDATTQHSIDIETAADDASRPDVIRQGSNKDIQFSTDIASRSINPALRVNMATFFSGSGTVDFALRNIVTHEFAVEYDAKIAAVYRANNGDNIYVDDVQTVNINPHKGKVEYFHASPVCKSYSGANNNQGEKPLDIETARATADAIRTLQPKVITVENVAGYQNSEAIKIIEEALNELGYDWDKGVYRATDFGGATTRERMFLRAVKDGTLPPIDTEGYTPHSWYDVTKDLIPNLPSSPLSDYMKGRMERSGIPKNITEPILILGGNKSGELTWVTASKPSPTILAKSTEARILMPDGRALRATPRVMARIQGLPDSYDLKDGKGGLTNAYKVVGNGIPVQLTQGIVGPLLEENLIRPRSEETGIRYSSEIDSPVSQAINSAGTSIRQVPALFKDKRVQFGDVNIDIGGGRFDLATNYLAERGTKNMLFDPYNQSEEVNTATLDYLMSGKRADTVTCANVLNVIAEPAARANVILEAAKAIGEDGTAYFMVYEGNGSGVGKETSAGYQNNRMTATYVPEIEQYFGNVERKGKLIIAKGPKQNLPKASWETTPGKATQYSTAIDSEGTRLTEAQQEYFKDSKIRDEDGNLLRMYHGTDADFNIFDFHRGGEHGTAEGFGIYLTDRKEVSESYGGRIIESYVNISRPARSDKRTIKAAELRRLIKETCLTEARTMLDDYDGKLNDALKDTWISNYTYTYDKTMDAAYSEVANQILSLNDNDMDIVQEVMSGMAIRTYDRASDFYDMLTSVTGIDGFVTLWGEAGSGDKSLIALAFKSNQVKNIDNLNPTKDVDIRFSTELDLSDEYLAELVKKYGAIPKGEKPQKEVQVPQYTSDGKRVRQFVRTVLESGVTTDDMDARIKQEILKEALSYEPSADKTAGEYAASVIRAGGVERAQREWDKAHIGVRMRKEDMVLGEMLIREYAKAGDVENVIKMVEEVAAEGTRAGQNIQAMRMLKKLATETPAIGLGYIQKTVDQMNRDNKAKMGKKWTDDMTMKIDPTLAAEYVNAETKDEIDAALGKIYQNLGEQYPKTLWETVSDKLRTWRYMSMLGNPRTHVRNIIGNAIFVPAVTMKNAIGAAMEEAAAKRGADVQRTKAFTSTPESRAFARQDADEMESILRGEGDKSIRDLILEQRKVYRTEALNALSKANGDALEYEDWIFLKYHYTTALSQYITANNLDVTEMDGAELAKARKYAVQEAQKATYRDANRFSSWLNQSGNAGAIVKYMMEGMVPFKKTPANILRRGIEYSPAMLVERLTKGIVDMNNDKITVNEWIDGMASGLTGSVIFALGMFLASVGAVLGGYEDDEDKTKRKLKGEQEYSARIGRHTYTIDWAAPASLPFFVGVEAMNALREDGEINFSEITAAAGRLIDPMINMSMLQGLNDTLEAISYADDKLSTIVTETFLNLLGQYVPTLFGQVARTIDTTQRINYQDKNKKMPKNLLYFAEKMQNKIPLLSFHNDPYLNEWGQENVTESRFVAALQNFISPGYISEVKDDPVLDELERLQEAQEENVIPKKMPKYLGQGKDRVDLTSAEYTSFQRVAGQTAYNILDKMIDDKRYDRLSADEQAAAIKMAYDYAKAVGRKTVQPEYELKGDTKKIYDAYQGSKTEAYDTILTLSTMKSITADVSGTPDGKGGTVSGSKKLNTLTEILDQKLGAQESLRLYQTAYPDETNYKIWKDAGGSNGDYLTYTRKILEIQVNNSGSDIQPAIARYIKSATTSDTKRKALWQMAGYKLTTFDKNMK